MSKLILDYVVEEEGEEFRVDLNDELGNHFKCHKIGEKEGRDDSFKSFTCKESVYDVNICPTNPNIIAVGLGDDTAVIYDINEDEPVKTLSGHTVL